MEIYIFALLGLIFVWYVYFKNSPIKEQLILGGGLVLITLAAYLVNRLLPDQTIDRVVELLAWAWIVFIVVKMVTHK